MACPGVLLGTFLVASVARWTQKNGVEGVCLRRDLYPWLYWVMWFHIIPTSNDPSWSILFNIWLGNHQLICHTIHVWYIIYYIPTVHYIYIHLPQESTKCRQVYHTWMVWVLKSPRNHGIFIRKWFVKTAPITSVEWRKKRDFCKLWLKSLKFNGQIISKIAMFERRYNFRKSLKSRISLVFWMIGHGLEMSLVSLFQKAINCPPVKKHSHAKSPIFLGKYRWVSHGYVECTWDIPKLQVKKFHGF